MKKKRVLVLIILIILITAVVKNNVLALSFTRTGGSNVNDVATLMTNGMNIDAGIDHIAASLGRRSSGIKVYNYNTTTLQTCTGHTPTTYSRNQYFLDGRDWVTGKQRLDYGILIPAGSQTLTNVATIVYEDYIHSHHYPSAEGEWLDFKVNIKKITKTGSDAVKFLTNIGGRTTSSANWWDSSTYTGLYGLPDFGIVSWPEASSFNAALELEVECFILDDNGNEYPISAFLGINDIDLNQGIYIDGFKADNENVYKRVATIRDTVKYKVEGNGTYFYSSTSANSDNNNSVVALLRNTSRVNARFTYENYPAFSSIGFESIEIGLYKRIDTKVTGGTITPTITGIKDGENKTVEYAPNDATRQYLKSVKVDGVAQTVTDISGKVDFTDIKEDHKVVVVYGNKYKVEFDTKGGSPTPETQVVKEKEKATEPTAPTREGYTFKGWKEPEATDLYNFDSEVTKDILLEAIWEPNKPTEAAYKVEHYKKNAEGKYDLAETENKTGKIDEEVTAIAKKYEDYEENKTNKDRVAAGKVKADGSLVLKLYYDPIIYKINYVLNGGENDPENPATYKKGDKVDFKPATREGYDFLGWYEDAEFTNPIEGIVNRTGDITVYAKWKEKGPIEYKVEHYKKNADGEYKLDEDKVEKLSGKVNEEVTAVARKYEGYQENTTYEGRVEKGVLKEGEELVLKLYYDPIIYKIEYELNGGKNDPKNPDTYTVDDKITFEPATRDKYEFKGWYEDAEFTKPITKIENRTGDIKVYAKWEETKPDVAPTPIPQTGDFNPIMLVLGTIAIVGIAVFGIKYLKLTNKIR